MPHIDIQTLLNSDIPHVSLKRCKSTPLNAYDTSKGKVRKWHSLICFHTVLMDLVMKDLQDFNSFQIF